ncbi:MAG: hypothetical protein RSA27_01020 [Oscillospiraceae bacterium]
MQNVSIAKTDNKFKFKKIMSSFFERFFKKVLVAKNKSLDAKQYEKYKEIIGKENMPKTLAKFKDMKYNDVEKYQYYKRDYKRRNRLLNHPELHLPNADMATAATEKFTKYLFDPSSKKGYAKGKAITSRLGYDSSNYTELKSEVLDRANKYPAKFKFVDKYGTKYEQKIILYGKNNKPANVIVAWMDDGYIVKMTSLYIKELK